MIIELIVSVSKSCFVNETSIYHSKLSLILDSSFSSSSWIIGDTLPGLFLSFKYLLGGLLSVILPVNNGDLSRINGNQKAILIWKMKYFS